MPCAEARGAVTIPWGTPVWCAARDAFICPRDTAVVHRATGRNSRHVCDGTRAKINPTVGEETEAEADGRTSTAPLPDPELPAEVVPAVDELFAIYVKPGEDVIFLSNISGGSTLQPNLRIGPSSFKPFEALLPMDLDGDGKVELSEMRSFFAHSGMGAEELKATLDEMISQATAAKLAQSLN